MVDAMIALGRRISIFSEWKIVVVLEINFDNARPQKKTKSVIESSN